MLARRSLSSESVKTWGNQELLPKEVLQDICLVLWEMLVIEDLKHLTKVILALVTTKSLQDRKQHHIMLEIRLKDFLH